MLFPLIFMSFFCTLKSQAMLKHEYIQNYKDKSLKSLLLLLMRLNQDLSFSTETSNNQAVLPNLIFEHTVIKTLDMWKIISADV